jgi:diacylglycerol kinase family enzyme
MQHSQQFTSWAFFPAWLCLMLRQVSRLSGDLLVLAASQARQMGRMINVCPYALLDDGLLDFTLLFGSASRQVRLAIVHTCST